jgi:excisionase family DNA binding protein
MEQNKEKKIAYSIPEAARLTGLSIPYLYALSAKGKLPVSKVGSRCLIMADELEKFLRVHIRNSTETFMVKNFVNENSKPPTGDYIGEREQKMDHEMYEQHFIRFQTKNKI